MSKIVVAGCVYCGYVRYGTAGDGSVLNLPDDAETYDFTLSVRIGFATDNGVKHMFFVFAIPDELTDTVLNDAEQIDRRTKMELAKRLREEIERRLN